jgi:hypothetical protein
MGSNGGLDRYKTRGLPGHPLGKNPSDVWWMATASYRGAHHAVYPVGLPGRAIKAGCPARRCSACKKPWEVPPARKRGHLALVGAPEPSCTCGASSEPGVVLDPFMGSGTTAVAAERLGRRWIGIELNPSFARSARERIVAARRDNGAAIKKAA